MQIDMEDVEIGNFETLESRARLQSSERYRTIMEVCFSEPPRWPAGDFAKIHELNWSGVTIRRQVYST